MGFQKSLVVSKNLENFYEIFNRCGKFLSFQDFLGFLKNFLGFFTKVHEIFRLLFDSKGVDLIRTHLLPLQETITLTQFTDYLSNRDVYKEMATEVKFDSLIYDQRIRCLLIFIQNAQLCQEGKRGKRKVKGRWKGK